MKTKIKLKIKIRLARTASLFFILFLMAINGNAVLAGDLYYDNPQITPAKMLNLTNQSRKENKLFALTVNQKLVSAAEEKTDDMFKFQYFEHNSPSGVTPWDLIKMAGYDYRYAGENLAIDFITAESAHKALMASDSHRENILNQNYTEIGISVKKNIFEGSESIIIVMEFGVPLKIQTEAAYTNNNINEDIKLSDDMGLDSNENNISGDINKMKKEPQKEITNLQPLAIPSDLKKEGNQNVNKNIEGQENKKPVHLNDKKDKDSKDGNENFEDSGKIVYGARIIKFSGMSTGSIKKINLEKVYMENIYWESYSKRNGNNQTTVMSSHGQNEGVFNPDVFYVCVLSILSVFELSYLFSNFVIGRKLKIEKI